MHHLDRILIALLLILATGTAAAQLTAPRTYPLASIGDRIVDRNPGGGGGGNTISVTLVHSEGTDLSSYDVAIVFGGLLYRGPFSQTLTVSRTRAGVYQRPLQIYLVDNRAGQVFSWRSDSLYALGFESSVEIRLLPARVGGHEFVLTSLERPESGGGLDVNSLSPIGGSFGDPHEGTNAFTMGDPHEGTNTFNRRGADGGAVNPGTTETEANQWYDHQQRTADSLEDLLSDNPEQLDLYMELGAANDSLGVHYNAIRAWNAAARIAPRNAAVLVGLARAYDNYVRDSVPGQKSLRQIITDDPSLGYAEQDERTTALDPLLEALKIDPANADGHALAGRIYRRTGERTKALFHAKKGADLAPRNPRYLVDLAAVYGDAGDNAKALDAVSRAVKIDGGDMRARRLLVGLLSRSGKHRDAITAATPIVRADSTDADAWLMIGIGHASLGKHADAIVPLRASVRHARNPGEAYAALGASFQALARNEEAAVAWQLAAEFRPDLADMHYRSGLDALAAGDRKRASKELEILRLMDSSRAAELRSRVEGR